MNLPEPPTDDGMPFFAYLIEDMHAYGRACYLAALEDAARSVEQYCGAWDATGPVIAARIRALGESHE